MTLRQSAAADRSPADRTAATADLLSVDRATAADEPSRAYRAGATADPAPAERAAAYARGAAAWPAVRLDPAVFAAHLARLGAPDHHAEDLFLACACGQGDRAALAVLERDVLAEVPRFIARIDARAAVADEVQQRLREYLLVAPAGGRPRIAGYAGRGPLGGWIRVIATRMALRYRQADVASDSEAASRMAASEPSPELALIRKRHGGELARALEAAIAGLADRDRGLVKLAIIDELPMDALCGLYKVHRTTLWRWIAHVKQQLFDAAVRTLRQRLALETAEIESLIQLVHSQLELSLAGVLEPGAARPADEMRGAR